MGADQSPRAGSTPPNRFRRKYIIKPGFQWKYTALAVVSVFVVSELLTLILFGVLYNQARARLIEPGGSSPWENTAVLVLSAAAFASVTALLVGLFTALATHRICGPLYVMEGFLKHLKEGRYPKQRPLRKRDEFKEFYENFWDTVNTLRLRTRSQVATLNETLDIARSVKDASIDARLAALKDLAARIEALRDDIAGSLEVELEQPGAGGLSWPFEEAPDESPKQRELAEART